MKFAIMWPDQRKNPSVQVHNGFAYNDGGPYRLRTWYHGGDFTLVDASVVEVVGKKAAKAAAKGKKA